MKSLLFVIPTMRMGGAERSLVSLLNALDPTRVQVDLLLFEGGGILQSQLPDWVHVLEADPVTRGMILEIRYHLKEAAKQSLSAATSRLWMSARSAIGKALKLPPMFSWDIVKHHIPRLKKHYDVAIGYLEGFTDFYVIDKVDASRKIGWIHISMAGRTYLQEEENYYNSFDHIAVVSEKCLREFSDLFPSVKQKAFVFPNLVSRKEILQKAAGKMVSDWDETKINIITVGRLTFQKGIDYAIEACFYLVKHGLPIVWHVFGDGELRQELEAQIKEKQLDGVFILEGIVENPYPYMKAADVLVQPSRWEGKSIVLDEAKILGKAIIATSYSSVYDQITDGVTGIVTGMEPEQIAEGIERVLLNSDLRKQLEQSCLLAPDETAEILDRFYRIIE